MRAGTDIVAAARGWLGTRFHHQGRIKKTECHKGGVDCLGLLVGVAAELSLHDKAGNPLSKADEIHYSHYPDTQRLRQKLDYVLTTIPIEGMAPGDVALFNIDSSPQHLAIVTDIGIIHAYAPARAVVEHALDSWWHARITAAFRI